MKSHICTRRVSGVISLRDKHNLRLLAFWSRAQACTGLYFRFVAGLPCDLGAAVGFAEIGVVLDAAIKAFGAGDGQSAQEVATSLIPMHADGCPVRFRTSNVGGGHLEAHQFDKRCSLAVCNQCVTLSMRLVRPLLSRRTDLGSGPDRFALYWPAHCNTFMRVGGQA